MVGGCVPDTDEEVLGKIRNVLPETVGTTTWKNMLSGVDQDGAP